MKAAGIVILFPLISVIIVSLYVQGGASRIAAMVLLIATVLGALAGLIRKRSRQNV
jgi:hypothetical protein